MTQNPRIAELRRRLEKDPASIAFAQLAEEHRRSGDFDQAVTICRDGLVRHPGYLSAQVTLGRALMELQQYEEARRELEAVLKMAPDNLAAIRALAVIHQFRRHISNNVQESVSAEAAAPAAPEVTAAPEESLVGESAVVFAAPEEPPVREASSVATPEPALDVPEEPAIDVPLTLGASDWTFDSDVELEWAEPAIEDVPIELLSTHEPALEQLEQWLAAIVADRQQSC
jgi:tetratricopeptide (TPR) repeat protein